MDKILNFKLGLKIYLIAAFTIVAGYIFFSAVTPNDPTALARYDISSEQLTLIKLSLVIPFLIYWNLGIFSGVSIKRYAAKLGDDASERAAMEKIGTGVLILVFGLIFSAFLGSLRSYLLIGPEEYVNLFSATFQDADIRKFFAILTNYLNVFLPLAAFWFIWKGSRSLVAGIKDKVIGIAPFLIALTSLLIIAASYIFLVFVNPYRQVGEPPINPTYYISDFMIFTTILVPYLIYWFLGVFSLMNITFYSDKVSGILYKKFFTNITIGFLLVVILSISLQFLSTIGYVFAQAELNLILMLIYPIIFIQALGYVFIARGVGKLKSIEDAASKEP